MDVIQIAKFSIFSCYFTSYYVTRIKQSQQNHKMKLQQTSETTYNTVNNQNTYDDKKYRPIQLTEDK